MYWLLLILHSNTVLVFVGILKTCFWWINHNIWIWVQYENNQEIFTSLCAIDWKKTYSVIEKYYQWISSSLSLIISKAFKLWNCYILFINVRIWPFFSLWLSSFDSPSRNHTIVLNPFCWLFLQCHIIGQSGSSCCSYGYDGVPVDS
jgi:hypothetical protein